MIRRPSRALVVPAVLAFAAPVLFAQASTPVATASAGSGSFSSWAVSTSAFFQDPTTASATATAAGRIWQVSFDDLQRPVLRWRRLDDGKAGAVRMALRPPTGAKDVTSSSFDGNGEDTQLFVADGQAFVAGAWCLDRDEDTNDCNETRAFSAQVSTRTGRVTAGTQGGSRRYLVGGTRVSQLIRPDGKDAYLRDLRTGRRVLTVPENARDVQGAGRFVSWKISTSGPPSDETGGPFWRTTTVVDRTTGHRRYVLAQRTLRRAIQPRGEVLMQQADLRADGSLFLAGEVDGDKTFRPVVVDARGRVRRVTRRPMRKPTQFTSEIRSTRVLLSVDTNGGGTCGPESGWITEIGGRRGNDLGGLPRSTRFRISYVPTFQTARTISWDEKRTGGSSDGSDRVRVGHDARDLALTTGQRPRC